MHRKVQIIITLFLGLPFFLEAQPRSVRLPWPLDENVWRYEVLIETELEGEYQEYLQGFTEEFFVIVSLLPGKYRYRVIPYNYLGRPEAEQSSVWMNFEIADLEEDIPAEDQNVFQEEAEEVFRDIERIARLWALGVSAGSTFATPWLTVTVHGTIAPWKYSFLEIGCDIGLITEVEDAEAYYSLYPFIHYALFMPFKTKGGWYVGIGGGCMMINYTYPKETVSENIFAVDAIIGLNFLNVLDLSYTLRTNFSGVSNKFLIGYTYRFR
jgi:hypothetical protein